nr:hypothetical protein Q903MT_gene581 [Picea sitchensis]
MEGMRCEVVYKLDQLLKLLVLLVAMLGLLLDLLKLLLLDQGLDQNRLLQLLKPLLLKYNIIVFFSAAFSTTGAPGCAFPAAETTIGRGFRWFSRADGLLRVTGLIGLSVYLSLPVFIPCFAIDLGCQSVQYHIIG